MCGWCTLCAASLLLATKAEGLLVQPKFPGGLQKKYLVISYDEFLLQNICKSKYIVQALSFIHRLTVGLEILHAPNTCLQKV